jgi:hypothetical protein
MFFYSGFILIFKDEVLMYMAQNASYFPDYSLMPLVNHKWLLLHIFFSRLCITSSFSLAACEFLGGFYEAAYNSKFPKWLK